MLKLSVTLVAFVLFQVALADKVKVDVYFEALCPDSKDFITGQLFPLYSDPNFKERLDLSLIPYGKASFKETNGELAFTCQHGPDECLSNTYLACSLKMYSLDQALKYTNCIMSQPAPKNFLESCATKLSLSYADLTACKDDKTKGPQYLKDLGNKTYALRGGKPLLFVPSVALNDKFERKEIPTIMSNFKKLICDRLQDKPTGC